MMTPKQALRWEVAYARQHETFRIRDALGRELWVEQPLDNVVRRRNSHGTAYESDLEQLRRRG